MPTIQAPPPQPNAGLSPEIIEAMKRRQMGGEPNPALNQMSPGAAGAPQVPPPMPQSEMTQASAPQGGPTGSAPQAPKFEPQDRTDLITLALIEQMKNDNKLQKEESKMGAASEQPMPAPAPQMPQNGAPVGGGGYAYQKPMGGGGFSMSPGYEQPMPVNAMQSNYASGAGKDYSGLNNYGKGGSFGKY